MVSVAAAGAQAEYPEYLQSAVRILTNRENTGFLLGLSDLADSVGVDSRVLSRAFRRYCGTSFTAMQSKIRSDESCRRIHSGEDLWEVSLNMGFADQAHFTRWFKKAHGVTPSEYRKQHQSRAGKAKNKDSRN